METEVGRKKYMRKNALVLYLIFFGISLICIGGILLWTPKHHYPAQDTMLTSQENAYKSVLVNWEGTWDIRSNGESLPLGDTLRAIAEYSRWSLMVEDKQGNRFRIPKDSLIGDFSNLRRLNPDFEYVYHASSLNGRTLEELQNEAGDYLACDVNKGTYYFPQIMLAEGSERWKGVVVTVDASMTVQKTDKTGEVNSNLYAKLPGFASIIGMNLLTKFHSFTVEQDNRPKTYKTLSSKFGTWFKNIFVSIGWFLLDIFLFFLILGVLSFAAFFVIYPLLYGLSLLNVVPNSCIFSLNFLLLIPIYIILLTSLYQFSYIWLLVIVTGIGITFYCFTAFFQFTPAHYRCSKCKKMNTKEVEEVDYLINVEVEPRSGNSRIEGRTEDITEGREVQTIRTDTHIECIDCHHVEDQSCKRNKELEWKPLAELPCPKCGEHALSATSYVAKVDLKTSEVTSRKKGKIKNKGFDFVDFETKYESQDTVNVQTRTSGNIKYDLTTICSDCEYKHEQTVTTNVDSGWSDAGGYMDVKSWKKVN